jgi:uncharacterized protein (TIGR01319 family)
MKLALAVDIGSTFTKLTLIGLESERVLAKAMGPSTVATDVTDGFNQAFQSLSTHYPVRLEDVDLKLACSSAAGGLRMIAVGLVPRLTVEAARIAAFGAGGKVVGTFSYELTEEDVMSIRQLEPDILLLTGGTDGGEKKTILHNAQLLARGGPDIPYIVAGNRVVSERIHQLFLRHQRTAFVVDNVMPEIDCLNTEMATNAIREVFIKRVTLAKGISKIEKVLGRVMMPTPLAVFKAVHLLAVGTDKEGGIGDVIAVDVGGATTDVVSMCKGVPSNPMIIQRGLPEPYAKRTVEGDIGMRWSAPHLLEEAGEEKILKLLGVTPMNLQERIQMLHRNVSTVPNNTDEQSLDIALARVAVEIATKRHAGKLERYYTPEGEMYVQRGKDLTQVEQCIGTGGPIVYSIYPDTIMKGSLYDPQEPFFLLPRRLHFYIDRSYILYALGLLAETMPDKAIRMMKGYLGFEKKMASLSSMPPAPSMPPEP